MSFQSFRFINKLIRLACISLNISGLKPHIFIETKLLSSSATHLCTSLGYMGLPLIRSTPVRSVTEIKYPFSSTSQIPRVTPPRSPVKTFSNLLQT